MRFAKPAAVSIVAAIAMALAGCGGVTVKPGAGSRGRIDNEATNNPNHLACMRDAGLPVHQLKPGLLQVGPLPSGPTVLFTPTPGAAQARQIYGQVQGAEAIGSALLWVNQGSEGELQTIESCLGHGVTG